MRVVALKAWSNGSISMEERQIAELPDALAMSLIAQGIVAPTALPEITDADDGKVLTADSGVWVAQTPASGGGVLVVTGTNGTLDKTWQEIHDAMLSSGAAIVLDDNTAESVVSVGIEKGDYSVIVLNVSDSEWYTYAASSADGYPTL